ncbi:MAG: hypothetical protein U0516_02465 [Candidatus Saccharibacteria bacterium]
MSKDQNIDLLHLREALEASWDKKTSYLGVAQKGNPALGQCYPTAWVVQSFFPQMEIIKGWVWTGMSRSADKHFWNGLSVNGTLFHIDLTWQQFPQGSSVREFEVLDRESLGDSDKTIKRCELLRQRVLDYIDANSG